MDYKFIVSYIRVTRCLGSLIMPIIAFSISSNTNIIQLLIVSIIVVMYIAATYSYNSIMDIKEDMDNPLHPKPFKFREPDVIVKSIPYMLFIWALLMSLFFTNLYSFTLFSFAVLLSILYSHFKIKRLFIIKTMTVSFFYMILFFSCYLAFSNYITQESLITGVLVFILVFNYSVLSDIRDIEPDRKHNFSTIPTRYGFRFSKILVMCIFALFNIIWAISYILGIISLKLTIVFCMFLLFEVYLLYCLHIYAIEKINGIQGVSFVSMAIFLLLF